MPNDFFSNVGFDLFCEDIANLLRNTGQGAPGSYETGNSNAALRAYQDAQTPEEFIENHWGND